MISSRISRGLVDEQLCELCVHELRVLLERLRHALLIGRWQYGGR